MTARIPSSVLEGLLYALTAFAPIAFGCVEPWSRAVLESLAFLLALACFLRGRRELPAMATWFWLFPAGFAALGALQCLTPAAADLPWILVIGCGSFTAHYCLTTAMRHADATVVVPVDFFRLPLIAVIGALFYAEPFDPAVIMGAAMIFAGVWFSLARERRVNIRL